MDFEPAQGGGVAGKGSGSELGRGDGCRLHLNRSAAQDGFPRGAQ
jgi:hypothetical protein